jgi:hypothetical protein
MVGKSNQNSVSKVIFEIFKYKKLKSKFTKKEKQVLRPIAEVLCLIDGNAFFGMSIDENGEDVWYEQYLPEAHLIWKANGGNKGWAAQVSWVLDSKHENTSVREAYEHWQLLKILARKTQ